MTEEQIKQNAEVYAEERCIRYNEQYGVCYDAYIAGAHSRDEEVEQLKKALSSAQQAMAELAQIACNTWISVKERLPEEGSDNISIPVAAITNKGYWFKGQFDFNNKDWFFSEDPDHLDFEADEFVTHWMPIPELKKGE